MPKRFLFGALWLQGCLLGVPVDIPDPALVGDPIVLEPKSGPDGFHHARVGTRVVVQFESAVSLDLGASRIALAGEDLSCVQPEPSRSVYKCERTLTGDEVEGRARLTAEMVDSGGVGAGTDSSGEILAVDFTPPTAGCVLTPREANARSKVVFGVVVSEALQGGAPDVVANDDRLEVSPIEPKEGQFRFAVAPAEATDINVTGYELQVTGT
ncbi:MAG: hypothetical protein KC656_01535, partial [Myxococcales bacterium]|nr:hypothetical protein [Myxococcales bacterium]